MVLSVDKGKVTELAVLDLSLALDIVLYNRSDLRELVWCIRLYPNWFQSNLTTHGYAVNGACSIEPSIAKLRRLSRLCFRPITFLYVHTPLNVLLCFTQLKRSETSYLG